MRPSAALPDFHPAGPAPAISTPTPSAARRPSTRAVVATGCIGSATTLGATAATALPLFARVTLGLVGMMLVVVAWLLLGSKHRQLTVVSLHRIAVVWALPFLVAAPLFSGDVWSYLAQGAIAASGQDPYAIGPLPGLGATHPATQQVSHYWIETPAPYGPAWLALSWSVATLTGEHLIAGVLLYRLIAIVGVILVAWALPHLARRVGADPSTALWLGLLNPLVIWHFVAGVHNDALMMGLLLCGTELVLRGMERTGAAALLQFGAGLTVLTVAANIKFVGFAAVGCLAVHLVRRRVGGIPTALVMALGSAAITLAISHGTGLGFGWIGALGQSTAVHSWMAPTNIAGFLAGGLGKLAGRDITDVAIQVSVVIGAVLGVIIVATLLKAISRGGVAPVRGLGLILAAVVTCGPVVHPWYLLWAVLPLAATAKSPRSRSILAAVSATTAMALPPLGTGALPLTVGYLGAAFSLGTTALLLHRRGLDLQPISPMPLLRRALFTTSSPGAPARGLLGTLASGTEGSDCPEVGIRTRGAGDGLPDSAATSVSSERRGTLASGPRLPFTPGKGPDQTRPAKT